MAKMNTIEQRAVGVCHLDEHNEGRIERNLFQVNGTTWEGLRFCKNKDGQHNRVHLVLDEKRFVELFRDAVKNGVFSPRTLGDMRVILEDIPDPFLSVIGSIADGTLSQNIDDELYPERPE
ncbi:MAG TPA: hypothetical protein VKT71_04565 [Candidatus Acidoferrales bacterium]|nr:hypothetical protein [Candidatus Acidoferrales bacterium]